MMKAGGFSTCAVQVLSCNTLHEVSKNITLAHVVSEQRSLPQLISIVLTLV